MSPEVASMSASSALAGASSGGRSAGIATLCIRARSQSLPAQGGLKISREHRCGLRTTLQRHSNENLLAEALALSFCSKDNRGASVVAQQIVGMIECVTSKSLHRNFRHLATLLTIDRPSKPKGKNPPQGLDTGIVHLGADGRCGSANSKM